MTKYNMHNNLKIQNIWKDYDWHNSYQMNAIERKARIKIQQTQTPTDKNLSEFATLTFKIW